MILSSWGVIAAAAGTLALGARRSRPTRIPDLPLPLPMMNWRLTDDHGKLLTPADWQGRSVIAFFGFNWSTRLSDDPRGHFGLACGTRIRRRLAGGGSDHGGIGARHARCSGELRIEYR